MRNPDLSCPDQSYFMPKTFVFKLSHVSSETPTENPSNIFYFLRDKIGLPGSIQILDPDRRTHLNPDPKLCLKVHKHEIILNFFLPESIPYMPLVNFRKKNFASYPSIFARILKFEHFCGD